MIAALTAPRFATSAAAVLLLAAAAPAAAASFGVEATTDLRRRGLGWSDGKPALEAWASLPLSGGVSLEAGAATLRGSARHGSADLLGEAALRYTAQTGPWTLWADAQGLVFAGGRGGQSYGQLRSGAAIGIGPAQLGALASWAPPQGAIGGSNVYFGATATVGVPGTPLTLRAGGGRSLGTDDGSGRAARLRPGGDYTDLRLDADYVLGPVTLGASVTTTSIDAATVTGGARDFGTRALLRASFAF